VNRAAWAGSLAILLWSLLIGLLSAPLRGLRLTVRHPPGGSTGLLGSLLLLAQATRFTAAALFGYVCAVDAAVTWALYSVLARRMRVAPTRAVIGYCAASAILAAAAHILSKPPSSLIGSQCSLSLRCAWSRSGRLSCCGISA
jgi:drug/metabolite transporter (DMT)-like permease